MLENEAIATVETRPPRQIGWVIPVEDWALIRRPVDPSDRLTWLAGDAAQCDLWFPPKKVPIEDGSKVLLPVMVIAAAHSRFMVGRMIPTRRGGCAIRGRAVGVHFKSG